MMGMAAPVIPAATAAAAPAPAPLAEVDDAEVLEETGDPYDNAGTDYAVGFEGGEEPTRATSDAGSSAGGWPEAHTVATHGWGQPAPAATVEVDEDLDEATHIGEAAEPTRHD
jgi:hypothetical protein